MFLKMVKNDFIQEQNGHDGRIYFYHNGHYFGS